MYILVINSFIAYWGSAYIGRLTVIIIFFVVVKEAYGQE